MFQISQSIFLQALGYSIINSIWQFAFLWLVYLLINSVINLSSHQKYTAAISLQVAGFFWFIITYIFFYNKCTYLVETGISFNTGLLSLDQMQYTGSIKDRVFTAILRTEVLLPYLSIAYLAMFFILILKWIEGIRYSRSLQICGLEKVDVQFRLFVNKLRIQLGIRRPVSVFISHRVKSPLTVGFFKPIILIPFASLTNLSCEQVEAVLLHELAHIKRSDYLINLLLSLIESVLFFNPFMQLISRHVKRERENSCDDRVLQFEYDAANYAKALLILATQNDNQCNSTLTMNAVDQKHSLLIRVKRMIEKRDRTFNYRNQLLTLIILAIITSFMAWLMPKSTRLQNVTSQKVNKIIIPEPMAAKIKNPFFNPVFFLADKNNVGFLPDDELYFENTNEKVPVFKISLPAFKTIELPMQEGLLNTEEPFADIINDKNYKENQQILNNEGKFLSAFDHNSSGTNIENFDVETDLPQVNASAKQQFSAGIAQLNLLDFSKINLEVGKALHSIKPLLPHEENIIQHKKQLHVRSLKDTAEKRLKLVRKQTLAAINRQVMIKLVQVSGIKEAESIYNNWKNIDKPATIFFTPKLEQTHTYSYDYTDKPGRLIGSGIIDTQDHTQIITEILDNQVAIEAVETINLADTILHTEPHKKVRKIIKRIKI